MGGNTPWRPAPVAPREPAQEPHVAAAALPRGQAGGASGQQEALPSPGLIRDVLVPMLPGGTLPSPAAGVPSVCQPAPSRTQGVQSWLSLSWEQGASMNTGFYRLGP